MLLCLIVCLLAVWILVIGSCLLVAEFRFVIYDVFTWGSVGVLVG